MEAPLGRKEMPPVHPYAELFPLHEGEPLWKLSDDIKENGQLEPAVMFKGQLLDGRRRVLGCFRAQVEPKFKEFKGTESEALTFVISKNLHRRHLGESERSFIAAKISNMPRGQNANLRINDNGVSQDAAATLLNVSKRSVTTANKVIQNGTPALTEAVQSGEVSVSDAAKIVDQPAGVQNAAVKKVRKKKAKTVTAAVAGMTEEVVKDEVGHIVPKSLLETFATGKRFDEMESLCRSLQKHLDEVSRLPGGEQLRMQLQSTKSGDKMVNKCKELGEVKSHLKFTRPYSVCPWCKGEKTKNCRCSGSGWIAKMTWDQSEDAVKARLACV